uniref:BPTI/Kunitz inhibitor domain-containing protein n=1 Tax=Pseudonaja textilis TaxID=8673 RepID=A0A670ZSJ5_PSETE
YLLQGFNFTPSDNLTVCLSILKLMCPGRLCSKCIHSSSSIRGLLSCPPPVPRAEQQSFEFPESALLPGKTDCSTLPNYTILCQMPVERFFYNVTSKSCQFFIDYGCAGSLNSYRSTKECEEGLQGASPAIGLNPGPAWQAAQTQRLPFKKWGLKGRGRGGILPVRTYSLKLTSGRCGGNGNDFSTRSECQLRCHKRGGCALLGEGALKGGRPCGKEQNSHLECEGEEGGNESGG